MLPFGVARLAAERSGSHSLPHASNGNLYARTGDRWGRDSRLRLEILSDLSHGHAQVRQ